MRVVRQRHGRPLQTPGGTSIALALRRQREAQGLSLRALAQRSGVSQYLIVEFEHSRRIPSAAQYDKLRTVLELAEAAPGGAVLSPERLTTLAACLVWSRGLPLAALATAAELTEAEVRQGIESVRDQLAAVGIDISVDQRRARATPLSWAGPAVRAATQVSLITGPELALLARLCRYPGNAATVAELEIDLDQSVRPLLAGLSDRGLVDFVAEGKVAERRYWITDMGLMSIAAHALQAMNSPGRDHSPDSGTTE
jgi:transcriptional regulator with XRE-family HTH domain